MKRLTFKKFADMTPEEIGKLKKEEMKELLGQARALYEKRAEQLSNPKLGRRFYSPAFEKIQEYYDENRMASIENISRNKAMSEVFTIQDFFRARTSTVEGARQVMREQDSRIFGVDEEKGTPLYHLTREQRSKYWEVYHEFLNQHKTAIAEFTSEKIQQYLGDRVIATKGRKLGVDTDTIESIWNDLHSQKFAEDDINASRNILTGRRNNRNN